MEHADESATALSDELIPFQQRDRQITVVRQAGALAEAVVAAQGGVCTSNVLHSKREIAERYLGPLDGSRAERTVAALREEAGLWAARRGATERELRERLARRRAPLRIARRGHAWSQTARRRVGAMLGR